MKTVLVYGDSNSHGTRPMAQAGVSVRHGPADRWPSVMATALGPDVSVICEGLPGRTTVHNDSVEGGARNGAAVLPAILHSHKPIDLLVIMLGTNDLKARFSVTAWEIARSVERLVLMSRAEGVSGAEMIVAPPPVRETGTLVDVFAGAETRQTGLADHMRAVAAQLGCAFVDAGAVVASSDTDGVHWEAGQHHRFGAHMAGAVADALEGRA
ncbi:SGNH/GDSL hydrolase family protein [Thalassococcus sp. CAU 1522]|uniref:SGNH/GDSL hydrolase family protein n=1 Tax=Thalassococcus arenae TaxID=2851652 RepID=A0ABS6NAK3_9RHOB|nr:SGNH/GDSL hydrolase family protein [Thalassococcus arenae]MBV2361024.1 SGNH/GDSL hydrolase family protein [Thalassococcus arenae]